MCSENAAAFRGGTEEHPVIGTEFSWGFGNAG